MNKGDALTIYLDYTINDVNLEEYEVDEIEFYFGGQRYTLSEGTLSIDEGTGKYCVRISQEQSFSYKGLVRYQIRIRIGDDVISEEVKEFSVHDSISREVI